MSQHITFHSLAHRMAVPRRRARPRSTRTTTIPLVTVGLASLLAVALWHVLRAPAASAASSPR